MESNEVKENIAQDLLEKYEFFNYGHALEILHNTFSEEWNEIQDCLRQLTLSTDDLRMPGGSKSPIPKKFDNILLPMGWKEIRIVGDLVVKKYPRVDDNRDKDFAKDPNEEQLIEGYIDGHNIDFLKNKVAFDLEWNSKDQTFDRDLLAMRTYHECRLVDVGIIVTRAEELNDIFKEVKDEKGNSIKSKYGASTTWMGKLIPRLDSRRNGGCPILAIGIKKGCVEGYGRAD